MSRGIAYALIVTVAAMSFCAGAWVGHRRAHEDMRYAEHLAKELRLCEAQLDEANQARVPWLR